jgi:hypothetical protein
LERHRLPVQRLCATEEARRDADRIVYEADATNVGITQQGQRDEPITHLEAEVNLGYVGIGLFHREAAGRGDHGCARDLGVVAPHHPAGVTDQGHRLGPAARPERLHGVPVGPHGDGALAPDTRAGAADALDPRACGAGSAHADGIDVIRPSLHTSSGAVAGVLAVDARARVADGTLDAVPTAAVAQHAVAVSARAAHARPERALAPDAARAGADAVDAAHAGRAADLGFAVHARETRVREPDHAEARFRVRAQSVPRGTDAVQRVPALARAAQRDARAVGHRERRVARGARAGERQTNTSARRVHDDLSSLRGINRDARARLHRQTARLAVQARDARAAARADLINPARQCAVRTDGLHELTRRARAAGDLGLLARLERVRKGFEAREVLVHVLGGDQRARLKRVRDGDGGQHRQGRGDGDRADEEALQVFWVHVLFSLLFRWRFSNWGRPPILVARAPRVTI